MIVTAVLASHNRRERTLACLGSLFDQAGVIDVQLRAVLVDDGSTDGTAAAVESLGYPVEVVRGTGSLYWAASMALAERCALEAHPDFLLWLNDDVVLQADALKRLLDVGLAEQSTITVGTVVGQRSGAVTYGGLVKTRHWHPLGFSIARSGPTPARVDTFHGNVVLVPKSVFERMGGIDGAYAHAWADLDYGLRARSLGFPIIAAPGAVGTCEREVGPKFWLRAKGLSVRQRLALALGPKGLPVESHARFLRRHGGRSWLLFFFAPYLRLIAELASELARDRVRSARSLMSSLLNSQ